jgi:hypothetical protein
MPGNGDEFIGWRGQVTQHPDRMVKCQARAIGNVEGPLTLTYTTNGYHVGLYVSPDSSGNIHANFNTQS